MKKLFSSLQRLVFFILILWMAGNTFTLFTMREVFGASYVDFDLYPLLVYDGMIDCDNEIECLHEVGHTLRLPEEREIEFIEAIDQFMVWCFAGGLEKEHYQQCAHALTFEGVLGNPMRKKTVQFAGIDFIHEWGGYSELYATLYQRWRMGEHYPYFVTRFYEEIDNEN